jgi:hypothetical protein
MPLLIVLTLSGLLLFAAPALGRRPRRPDEGPARAGPGQVRQGVGAAARPGAGARARWCSCQARTGAPAGITPVARDIVRRVRGLQMWIVDRRQQAFEDTSVFEWRDPDAALDYSLGFRYRSVKGTDARFVSEWGLDVQLRDLRSVVRPAARGGREVILGGHSAGASTAVAYAAWDFAGRAGWRDLSGLLLPPAPAGLQAARRGYERGPARLRLRRHHLTQVAGADPHPRRPRGARRGPAPLARRRADADPPLREGLCCEPPQREPSGTTRAPSCSTSTPPARCA